MTERGIKAFPKPYVYTASTAQPGVDPSGQDPTTTAQSSVAGSGVPLPRLTLQKKLPDRCSRFISGRQEDGS